MESKAMALNSILLVDLRINEVDSGFAGDLASRYRLKHVKYCKEIDTSIAKHCPDILCFDYDTPTTDGLAVLRSTKFSYPSLPIIMLTEQHSESLALWALRSRVWDYFIKPVTMEELEPTFDLLTTLARCPDAPRQPCYPRQRAVPAFIDDTKVVSHSQGKRTQPSIQYVEDHYAHRIRLNDAAKSCHLSPSAFSHLFRKEQGMTFSEHLLRYRITRASELLAASTKSVSEIAYTVGFNDLPYFSRVFRRFKGVSPCKFRQIVQHKSRKITAHADDPS